MGHRSNLRIWVLMTAMGISGCVIPAERVNNDCRWARESHLPLDHARASDQRHLATDAVTAEELAIRYADTHRGFRSSAEYVGPREYAAAREECLARLFGAIASNHDLQPAAVRSALRQRSLLYDAAVVVIPMTWLFWMVARRTIDTIERRFTADERGARVVTLVLASLAVDVILYQLGRIWAFTAEERLRLRTNHLSYRASYIPWSRHALAVLVTGFVLFWAIVTWRTFDKRRQA